MKKMKSLKGGLAGILFTAGLLAHRVLPINHRRQ